MFHPHSLCLHMENAQYSIFEYLTIQRDPGGVEFRVGSVPLILKHRPSRGEKECCFPQTPVSSRSKSELLKSVPEIKAAPSSQSHLELNGDTGRKKGRAMLQWAERKGQNAQMVEPRAGGTWPVMSQANVHDR